MLPLLLQRIARIALLALCALAPMHGTAAQTPVVIGILAPEGADAALKDWEHIGDYLNQALQGHRFRLQYFDLTGLHDAVAQHRISFAITNSGHYVELEAAYGIHRIATVQGAQAVSPTEALASAIIVRNERADLRSYRDLAGKRVLAVSENAFGGYLVAWHELRQSGIEPDRDFGELAFSGFPLQKIVQAVAEGTADAGIVRACVLENMAARGEIRLADFRVLGAPPHDRFPCLRSTRLYPDWPIAALRETPHALSKQVATALLAMPATPGGIGWTAPTDYRAVHELYRELQMGPYADMGSPTFGELVLRYRWWLALLVVLVAAGIIHTVRAEQLVQSRTRELRQALRERESMERAARSQQEKLDHLARLGILGELSSMLAHELNQPLSAIGNFARGMERRIESGRMEQQALLTASQEIAEQAERARGIMQRIRSFSKKRESSRARLRLAEAIESAIKLFDGIGPHAPHIACRLDPEAAVYADRLQIEQVLLNLLKNALDAMQTVPADGCKITVTCRRVAGNCHVCVSDRGGGVDSASHARLFEPFFTTKPDGMGLGLAICKSIIEAHGGRLWAEANLDGVGLSVCFSLPEHEEDSDHG